MFKLSKTATIAAACTAIATVGGSAYVVSSQNTSSTSTAPGSAYVGVAAGASSNAPLHHRRRAGLLDRAEHAVVTIYSKKSGSVVVTLDRGVLSAITSSSLTLTHLDGTSATATITSATKFRNASEATLASDIASGTKVRVYVVQVGGSAKTVVELKMGRHLNAGGNTANPAVAQSSLSVA